jgi:hypothetical protein
LSEVGRSSGGRPFLFRPSTNVANLRVLPSLACSGRAGGEEEFDVAIYNIAKQAHVDIALRTIFARAPRAASPCKARGAMPLQFVWVNEPVKRMTAFCAFDHISRVEGYLRELSTGLVYHDVCCLEAPQARMRGACGVCESFLRATFGPWCPSGGGDQLKIRVGMPSSESWLLTASLLSRFS